MIKQSIPKEYNNSNNNSIYSADNILIICQRIYNWIRIIIFPGKANDLN